MISAIGARQEEWDKYRRTIPGLVSSVLEICVGSFDGLLAGRCRPISEKRSRHQHGSIAVTGEGGRFSHKSDVVIVVHLHSRCQQWVSLTEDCPHDPDSLAFNGMSRCLEAEMEIPTCNQVSLASNGENERIGTCR